MISASTDTVWASRSRSFMHPCLGYALELIREWKGQWRGSTSERKLYCSLDLDCSLLLRPHLPFTPIIFQWADNWWCLSFWIVFSSTAAWAQALETSWSGHVWSQRESDIVIEEEKGKLGMLCSSFNPRSCNKKKKWPLPNHFWPQCLCVIVSM